MIFIEKKIKHATELNNLLELRNKRYVAIDILWSICYSSLS